MRLLREPVVWFLVLGTALFLAYRALAPAPRDTIVVTREAMEAAVQQAETMTGMPADAAQREQIIEGYIDDEVLLREAFRRGYHETDYRTRKRLLGIMRTTLTRTPPAPSRTQLEAYFRENRHLYERGQLATFDQVLFTANSEQYPEDPAAVRAELVAGADFAAMGDRSYNLPSATLQEQSQAKIRSDFGARVAEAVATLPLENWSEPLESRGGLVFVRVRERRDSPPPSFDALESYLAQDYIFQKTREAQSAKIAELRTKYRIEIEEPEAP